MKKNVVKINEATIKKMVADSVKKTIKEGVVGPGDPNYDVFLQKLHDYQKECERIDAEFKNSLTPEEKEYISQGGNWLGKWGRELELRKKKGLTRPPKPTYERGKSNYFDDNGLKEGNNDAKTNNNMESNISKVLRAASKDDNQYKQGMKHVLTHMDNKMREKAAKDMEKRKNAVKIDENTIRQIVAESVNKVLKEGWPHLLPLDGDGESKYYFQNNKKWLRIANKAYHYLGELSQYLGHNGEDEDCENIEQAMSSVEAVINSLESYGE